MANTKAAEPKLVAARIARDGYRFRGKLIPKGRIVRVPETSLEAAKQINPPFLVKATAEEAKKAGITELPEPEPIPAEDDPGTAESKSKKR